MNRGAIVGGASATLAVDGGRLKFRRDDGSAVDAAYSCVETSPGTYSVVLDGRVYRVTAAAGEVLVNGRRIEIEVFDPRDRRADSRSAQAHGAQKVAASMPGKVVRVLVTVGEEVVQGQGLVVVEAMKMQNEMKSPRTGRVAEVRTKTDATVTAGEVLVVVE